MTPHTPFLALALLAFYLAPTHAQKAIEPPPNAPPAVTWEAGTAKLSVRYHGTVILEGTIRGENAAGQAAPEFAVNLEQAEVKDDKMDKLEKRLKFVAAKPQDGVQLVFRGTATGSHEAFPAETEHESQKRFAMMRTSVGLSHSLRNNAVYDRRWDWQLAGPANGATHIKPKSANAQKTEFSWESRGTAIELVFRPHFYSKHRELHYFEPWTYDIWKGPVTGYCTWWAYKHGFTQKVLDELVEVWVAKKLPDFGYKYIQFDDAYQTGNGSCPQNWLTWNNKFPGGPDYSIKKIRSAGMEPGIWVHRVHRPSDPHVADIGKEHPDWFVSKPDGKLYMDGGFYVLNTKNKEAIEGMVRPIYRELKKQGWSYVKIDGAGDLLYSYKNKPCEEHFQKIGSTPEDSLRDWDRVAREELGPETFILTCWGVRPGVCSIGYADGCRLSDDGFGPTTFQRFASYNGVVFRGDPDHCDVMAPAFKEKTTMKVFGAEAAMADTIDQPTIVAMAGGVLMTSDKVEDYKVDANLEGMKRSSPVLFTVPGQLYDYGNRANKDFHSNKRGGEIPWWLQEIDRPFDHWSVLARFNWRQDKLKWARAGMPEEEVKFSDLGLADDRDYLVFEFWTQTYLGKSKGSFKSPAMDVNTAVQVFAIREARPHPWVLSTTRHLSSGGVCLQDERWDGQSKVLAGKSTVVSGDPYVMTIHLPQGFQLKSAVVAGEMAEVSHQKETATVRVVPSATKTIDWKLSF